MDEERELGSIVFTESDRQDLVKKSIEAAAPYLNKFIMVLAGGFVGIGIIILLTRSKKREKKK